MHTLISTHSVEYLAPECVVLGTQPATVLCDSMDVTIGDVPFEDYGEI